MAKKSQLDIFDVVYRFAENPLGCVGNIGARSVLREQDFGWRPWIGKPLDSRRAGPPTPGRWEEKFWDSLNGYLQELVEPGLGPRFADLLVGYLLVLNNETPSRNHKDGATGITRKLILPSPNDAKERNRELKRLRRILGPSLTSNPQRRDSLQLIISAALVNDLVASGLSRKDACEDRLPEIWSAVGIKVNGASVLRMERRRRHKS
jgi:hypothetical protein